MTTSTISPVATAASDALDAPAASTIGRTSGGATWDAAPLGFQHVLAAETGATTSEGKPAATDGALGGARDLQQVGRSDAVGATDPQPDHGRDDEHAVGRTSADRGREATETSPTDGTANADDADDARAADAAPAPGAQAGSTNETAASDSTGEPASNAQAAGAGKGHRKSLLASVTAPVANQTAVAVALLTPAVTGTQQGATPGATGSADARPPRNANAATPADPAAPAIPAGKAADGIAVPATPATPAVPAHAPAAAATPAPAAPGPATPTGAGATSPAVADLPAATAPTTALAADAAAVAAATGGPGSAIAATATSDSVAGMRQGDRSRGAAAGRPGRATGTEESSSVDQGPDLPTTASDVARARASIARIVAAGADDGADARHRGGEGSGTQGAVPATSVLAATPAADAAQAAIAAARQASPATSSAPSATAAASAPSVVPAADRLAFEAIDRIRTTVTAGVPGLESRIEDPDLGTIRVVVSARVGETIRAEIVARDPAAARELASGIDRAIAAGAALPANVDLRVRSEAAASTARSDAHLGHSGGEHAASQDQSSAGSAFGGRADSGAGGTPGREAGRAAPTPVSALAPAHGRSRGLGPVPVAVSSTPGALRPGTALDVRA
jgi:hypothetical protein